MTVAVASYATGQFLGEMNAKEFAEQMFAGCELPILSKQTLPHIDSFGFYGTVLAALIIISTLVGFRLIKSEEGRYRLVAIVHTIAWPAILGGTTQFFLAAYALPYLKCTV